MSADTRTRVHITPDDLNALLALSVSDLRARASRELGVYLLIRAPFNVAIGRLPLRRARELFAAYRALKEERNGELARSWWLFCVVSGGMTCAAGSITVGGGQRSPIG